MSPAEPPAVDLALLSRRVHRAGGDVLVARVLDRLMRRVEEVLAAHPTATDAQRHAAFHNLKTSLRTVGALGLGDRAEALDEGYEDRDEGRAAPDDGLDALVEEFAARWRRARPELEALRDAAREGRLTLPPLDDGPGRGP